MPLVTLSGLLFFLLMTDTILARIWGEIKERDRRKRATRRIEFGVSFGSFTVRSKRKYS